MYYLKWVPAGLAACLALAGAGILAGAPAVSTSNIASSPLWDDGKAEFSTYVGSTERYGQERPTEARIIVVKEDLVRATLVKSDSGPIPGKTLEVLKLNFLADFPTGTYTYHQMATVMFDRSSLEVLKETMSHTESCGITFVRVGPKNGRLVHEAHSYWDGQADREVPVEWPPGERLYWDGLPVSLRRWVAGGRTPFEIKVSLLPSQISGQSPIQNTRPVTATLRMRSGGTIEVPAGRFATRQLEVSTPAGTDRFWFDERFPHVLVKMETHAGRMLALKKTQRLDYWNHHRVGDERLLM